MCENSMGSPLMSGQLLDVRADHFDPTDWSDAYLIKGSTGPVILDVQSDSEHPIDFLTT